MNTSKLKSLLAFVFTVLISYGVSAQDYIFKVTSVKGDAKVDGTMLKVGSKINAGTITVADGALLNIVHKGGKALNVSKAGTYQIDALDKACSAKPGSLSERYAAYVLKELTTGDDSGIGAKNQAKTGSVERDFDTAPVAFMKPYTTAKGKKKNTLVVDGMVTIQWFPNENVASRPEESQVVKYMFHLEDLFGQVIKTFETDKAKITIDLSEEALSGKHMKYQVVAMGDNGQKWTSSKYMLEPMKTAESLKIKQDLESIAADNSALSKLIVAKYFEEKGLVANALYAYEEAVKLSNANDMYKNMYQAFLDRNYLRKSKAKMTKGKEKEKKDNK
ncbi:MAG: hypothetical protein ACPGJS_11115 [Flammeovirgaceae bacterium]